MHLINCVRSNHLDHRHLLLGRRFLNNKFSTNLLLNFTSCYDNEPFFNGDLSLSLTTNKQIHPKLRRRTLLTWSLMIL